MAKDKITEYDATANNNTVCGDVNIAENSALPSDMNNFAREIMSHLKEGLGSGTPLYVDQTNNRLGIGTSSPDYNLQIEDDTTSVNLSLRSDSASNSRIYFGDSDSATIGAIIYRNGNNTMAFEANGSEAMRISGGNVGIGTSSPHSIINAQGSGTTGAVLTLENSNTALSSGNTLGSIEFYSNDASTNANGVRAKINANASSASGATDIIFSNTVSADTTLSERMRIDASGNVGIGTTSPADKVHIIGADGATSRTTYQTSTQFILDNNSNTSLDISTGNSHSAYINFHDTDAVQQGFINYDHTSDYIRFGTNGSERMRIRNDGRVGLNTTNADAEFHIEPKSGGTNSSILMSNDGRTQYFRIQNVESDDHLRISANDTTNLLHVYADGNFFLGKTNSSSSVEGVRLHSGVNHHITVNAANVILFNRGTNDGQVVGIAQADSTEGNISVSGNTVSYNAFSASHWSRLNDNSKPTILKGTVIETIDEMMDWYQLTFTVPATDDTPEHSPKISIALEDGQSVGDTITYNHEGIDYQATIIQEGDNKHTKCKISDTADSTRVYGVFADWDNDDDTVNDMYVTAVGTHVVRVHSSATVSAGDLLVSNGDGTAKVQDDDIIRSKTIGKVLTNIVQETYDDGSYTVPCALYCG